MTSRLPTFTVEVRIGLLTDIDIPAADFADALERAKGLKIQDFITIRGGHNDSRFDVVSVSDKEGWRLDR